MKKSIATILSVGLVVLFSGCQQKVQTPVAPKIDATLPMIEQSSIRHIPDMTSIALEWKKIDISGAAGYHIIRANMQEDGKFKRIATLNNKFITHYLDTDLEVNSKYGYKISLLTDKGFESRASDTLFVSTLPRFDSVSLIEATSNLPRQIKILWRPHANERVLEYVLERTSPLEAKWKKIATIKNRLNVEYIDEDLGDNELFMYRLRAVTFENTFSNFSDVVNARTKPLPEPVKEFQATTVLAKKIKLSWTQSPTPDIAYYNIYRSSSAQGSYSKIAQASLGYNTFEDSIGEDNKIYFYKITVTDKDGLESKLEDVIPIMGSSLGKPKMPQLTLAMIEDNKMVLNWIAGDNRAVSYNIYKKSNESWGASDEVKIPNIQGLRFEDPNVVRGIEYGYSIQSVDKNGLLSEKTDASKLKLPIIMGKGQTK